MQLVTGDYPDPQMLHQRALHQQLDFTRPLRLAALGLRGCPACFASSRPSRPKPGCCRPTAACQQLQQQPDQQGTFPLLSAATCSFSCCRMRRGKAFSRKNGYSSIAGAGGRRGEFVAALRPSAPVRQPQGYLRALSQARQALDLCDTLRPTQRISDYQQLGFIKLLSAVSDPALLNDFMHDTSAA